MLDNGTSSVRAKLLVPRVRRDGVLSYDAWLEKTVDFRAGMRDFVERAIRTAAHWGPDSIVRIDMENLFDAFFRYTYRTSANRFTGYHIII